MAYNSVIIKNYLNIFEEYEANAALSPGMLVELMSTGKIRKHATESGNAVPMFAIENRLEGKSITDAYAAADRVTVIIPQRGDEIYAQIEDEQTIAIGDFLESNGLGYLQKHTDQDLSSEVTGTVNPLEIVAQALEALDLSSLSAAGSSDTPARQFLRVRIV